MRYAVRYYADSRTLSRANELIIKYNKKTPYLIKFAEERPIGQRLIVDISGLENVEENIDIFKAANEICGENFAIMTTKEDDVSIYAEAGLKYFFIEGAGSLDEVTAFLEAGVSDIYIINELGFWLKQIAPICHSKDVIIRVFPNVAQSLTTLPINSFSKFFIRPEDIDEYEDLIDIYEFFGPLDKQDVLYDIYSTSRWLGDLNNIILGLDESIDNLTIVPHFGQARTGCNKRCAYNSCNICGMVKEVADSLKSKDIGMKHERRINAEALQNDSAETIESAEEISDK